MRIYLKNSTPSEFHTDPIWNDGEEEEKEEEEEDDDDPKYVKKSSHKIDTADSLSKANAKLGSTWYFDFEFRLIISHNIRVTIA